MTQPLLIRIYSETVEGEPVLLCEWSAYQAPMEKDVIAVDDKRYEVLPGCEWIPRANQGRLHRDRTIIELVGRQL